MSSPEGKRSGPREVHSEDWSPPPSWKPWRRQLGCRSLRQTDLQKKRNLRAGSLLSSPRSISPLSGGPMSKWLEMQLWPVLVPTGLLAAASRRRIKLARRLEEISSSISHFFGNQKRPRRTAPNSSSDTRNRPVSESPSSFGRTSGPPAQDENRMRFLRECRG